MTVTYSLAVGTVNFAGFAKLLLRWRGSIYKLVLRELLVFAISFYALSGSYQLVMNTWQKDKFEEICIYFREWMNLVPITFVLAFYVTMVANRWWNIYCSLPWVDRVAFLLNTYLRGDDERGRIIRRTIIRYLNLSTVLCLRGISTTVKKRFPTMQHIVDAKLMTSDELKILENGSTDFYLNYFQPIFWSGTILAEAEKEGRISDNHLFRSIVDEIGEFRACLGNLLSYDWISVPLAYTQVVSLATYAFFTGCLFGRQFLFGTDEKYGLFPRFVPLFTFIQFLFYVGWLKVAEVMINPLGEDDDDFELNCLIDRNVDVGFMMVDDLHGQYPTLRRDPFWDEEEALVPYTEASAKSYKQPYFGSAAMVDVPADTQQWALEEDQLSDVSGERIQAVGRKLADFTAKAKLSVANMRRAASQQVPTDIIPTIKIETASLTSTGTSGSGKSSAALNEPKRRVLLKRYASNRRSRTARLQSRRTISDTENLTGTVSDAPVHVIKGS